MPDDSPSTRERWRFTMRGALGLLTILCAALALFRFALAQLDTPVRAVLLFAGVWFFGAAPGFVFGASSSGLRKGIEGALIGGFLASTGICFFGLMLVLLLQFIGRLYQ